MTPARYSPGLFFDAVLVAREDFTEGVARFRFRLDGDLRFRPGQYATLAREHEGALIQRPYSICSEPGSPLLEFYCDLVPGGAFSPIMWHMEVGEHALVRRRTAGLFTLGEDPPAGRHLFAATVTGAAPFISMIRDQRARLEAGEPVPAREFLLVHGCSRSAELGEYLVELAALADAVPWFHYVPTVSRPAEDPDWRGETGRVEEVLRKHADRHGFLAGEATGYACGNPDMVTNVKGILRRARFAESRIREERYYAGAADPDEDA